MIGLLVNGMPANAQTNRIEIYKAAMNAATSPVQRTDAALSICSQSYSLNNDTLYYYASLAKKISVGLRDVDRQTMANVYLEDYLTRRNLFDSSIKMCNNDLAHLDYDHNRNAYVQTMMRKCYCLARANRNTSALDVSYAFLAQAEKNADTASQIFAKCIIGVVYRDMQQTDLAMNWFIKADATAGAASYEAIKNEFGVYFLLGLMYNWRFSVTAAGSERLRDSVQSIAFLDRAIADSRRFENLSMLARTLNVKAATIGNKENVEAEGRYVKEAAHIYAALNDTTSMLNAVSSMCYYYMDEGQPQKGVAACKEAIKIAIHGNSYPTIDLYEVLSQCYFAAGDYPDYAATLNAIIQMKDSLYKVNSEQDLAELNARYENQKKENIIILQKLDITSKKYSILLISIALGLLLIGIILLYRYYSRKQKRMKQEEIAAIANAREGERKRISADLHDNIGAYAAAASSTIGFIKAKDAESTHRLNLLKNNIRDMMAHLNDSIWALNKKEVYLTSVSDRFKIFIQKLQPSYPHVSILIEEKIEMDYLLSSFQALHLYRIMQEALNNALRHSQCATVKIDMISTTSVMKVIIADDGIGMSQAKLNGNGINNLRARASELGWKAEWVSQEHGGTQVVINSGGFGTTTNSALADS